MMIQEQELITAPAVEPITLATAKTHLRVDHDAENDLITALITASREYVEGYTGRALITQARRVYMDRFYNVIPLPYPKLQVVSSITYIDEDGATQTVDSSVYRLIKTDYLGQVILKDDEDYPDTESEPKTIQINYTCGYGDTADDVPVSIKQAMLLLIGGWYQNRESIVFALSGNVYDMPASLAVKTILDKYKVARV